MELELFTKALGIEEPLYIKEIIFDKKTGELHIYVDFIKGSRFACSECQTDNLSVYDTTQKTWRH
jgi:transposase